MSQGFDADVVIVGAGVCGALVGWRLATAGVRVLILESGPRVDRAAGVERFRQALARTPESAYEAVPYAPRPTTDDLDGYYVQAGPDKFKSTYERRVGGTTWHWLGTTLRFLPSDFQLRTRYGVGVDWPLSYADLEQWYTAAEQAIGVAGDPAADLGVPRGSAYPLPPIPRSLVDQRVAEAAAQLGLQVEPTPQARNSQLFDSRPFCCGNAMCIPICPIGAKWDAAHHVAKAEAAGARVVSDAVANQVVVDGAGRVSGIRFLRPDRSAAEATGRVYVLAAHAIETPKLLLMSRTAALPGGVANRSDQVGRNLMDHPTQLSWALAVDPVYGYRGPLSTSGIESTRDDPERGQRGAFRVEIGNDGWSWPGLDPMGLAQRLLGQGVRGTALRMAVAGQIPRQFRLAALVEQLPDPANRVTLADQTDALGLPRPRIEYRVDNYVKQGLAAARALHDRLFDALGVSERHHYGDADYQGAGHIVGTYRMGSDPHTSVVDADCRSHDHRNLFLLGSGTFPTIACSNPTLTIAALALRAVDPIRQTLTATPS